MNIMNMLSRIAGVGRRLIVQRRGGEGRSLVKPALVLGTCTRHLRKSVDWFAKTADATCSSCLIENRRGTIAAKDLALVELLKFR